MADSLQKTELVERLAETIRRHYTEPITVRWLADAIGHHSNYLARLFRERMGITIRTYLTRYRLERAASLIAHGDKIEAVSLCVGYRSKRTLYRQFKRYFGVTPEQYRHLPRCEWASIEPDGLTPQCCREKRVRRW
jgi:two-component system response regulator YesN